VTRKRDKKRDPSKPPGMPEGAVAADQSKQVPNNSYSPPPVWYVDMPFVCVDCGSEELWTAEQQKWYYEEAKGSLYATAKRCRECRRTAGIAKKSDKSK
jgi:hypothetical protein